ncbi:hypothetical protein JTB14_006540 [Gonioctena quinquepunctata]|nr:hypothetical protein JTB14_006540 [Gonioctena quinquepunctata]
MHETREYPDTDMSDEDSDDSDADPNYQAESESYDSDTDDSMLRASASISNPQPERNRITSRSPSPQPSTSRGINRSPSPQSGGSTRSPSPQQNTNIASPSSPQSDDNVCDNIVWTDPVGNQKVFQFTGSSRMDPNIILDEMVNETNLYATQVLEKSDAAPSSRLHDWTPTDSQEMIQFIGLLEWMGLVKVPKMADYWRQSELYAFPLPKRPCCEIDLRYCSDSGTSPIMRRLNGPIV